MKTLSSTLLIIGFIAYSSLALGYPEPAQVPNAQAFSGWQDKANYISSKVDLNRLDRVQVNCEDQTLFATHPQQTQKTYHVFKTGRFHHAKLTGDDAACFRSSSHVGPKGTRFCLRGDVAEYAVISDVFMDRCGNVYRGFWEAQFLKKEESMGSLFSKGRTLYQDTRSQFKNDMILGGTYPVAATEFLFFSEVFPGDLEVSEQARDQVLKNGFRFNQQTLLFEEPK